MKEPLLKDKLKLVARYYCGECMGNAEQSVIRAGYSVKYARGNAYKIINKPEVQEYIKYLSEKAENESTGHVASVTEIQEFWTRVMHSGEVKMNERIRASELLAKAKGMFNDDWS